jgi:hypothetical protein
MLLVLLLMGLPVTSAAPQSAVSQTPENRIIGPSLPFTLLRSPDVMEDGTVQSFVNSLFPPFSGRIDRHGDSRFSCGR